MTREGEHGIVPIPPRGIGVETRPREECAAEETRGAWGGSIRRRHRQTRFLGWWTNCAWPAASARRELPAGAKRSCRSIPGSRPSSTRTCATGAWRAFPRVRRELSSFPKRRSFCAPDSIAARRNKEASPREASCLVGQRLQLKAGGGSSPLGRQGPDTARRGCQAATGMAAPALSARGGVERAVNAARRVKIGTGFTRATRATHSPQVSQAGQLFEHDLDQRGRDGQPASGILVALDAAGGDEPQE